MPPKIWARYSPSPIWVSSASVSPKRPFGLHAAGVARHLADRLDISREPGEPVRGVLLALEFARVEAAAFAHARPQPLSGAGEQVLDGAQGFKGEVVGRHGLLPQAECCIAQCVGA